MKHMVAAILSLSLAGFAGQIRAEELNWRPVSAGAAAGAKAPALIRKVALGRPVPLAQAPANLSRPVIRGKAAEGGPQLLPELPDPKSPSAKLSPSLVRTSFACDCEPLPGPEPAVPCPPGPVDPCAPCPPCPAEPCRPCPEGPCCDNPCCVPEDCCASPCSRFYVSGEYLFWGIRHMSTPPLVTAGTTASQGILPAAGTTILFGGSGLDQEPESGGRVTAGWWLDPCQTWGIEASGFVLGERSANFFAGSFGLPVLARPFFNLTTGLPSAEIVAFPGRAFGTIAVDAPSQLWGAELDLRRNLWAGCWWRVDLLGGFRYVQLDEGLHVTEHGTLTAPIPAIGAAAGDQFTVLDRFDTRNQFYGGQLGADAELRRGPWSLDIRAKVALGDMHQALDINGSQSLIGAAGPRFFSGGLLALPGANSGHFSRDRFSVVPEVGLTLGYDLTSHLRIFAGYNFLYLGKVLRPGDQVDLGLNTALIPNFNLINPGMLGPLPAGARPAVPFREANFWAQGVSCGLEFHY